MHNDNVVGSLDDTRALVRIVYVGKVRRLQARDQEEEEERIARLARKRDHQAQVIKKSFKDDDVADVFCKHMMTMLILPIWEINDDVSVEGSGSSRVKGRTAGKRSRPPCAGDQKRV